MHDSLNFLKQFFPDFLNKDDDSNFTKFATVMNSTLQELRQRLNDTYYLNKLYRPVLIKRTQEEEYECNHTVYVDVLNIKSIKVFVNDTLIETQEFEYDDHVYEWEKEYYDVSPFIIVPDVYRVEVETYNEMKYIAEDRKYDKKLDILGSFLNCPRLDFKDVEEYDYPYTYPPFNFDDKEPDWYYLARMTEYISLMEGMPAPCLYIWKKYMIETELNNRKRTLAQIGNYTAHPERKHMGVFLQVNTYNPYINQIVHINTFFLSDEVRHLKGVCAIFRKKRGEDKFYCYSHNEAHFYVHDETPFEVCAVYYYAEEYMPDEGTELVVEDDTIMTEVKTITPRSDDVDYYVSMTGNDEWDGKSPATAFRTLDKALYTMEDGDLIQLGEGTFSLKATHYITCDCVIRGHYYRDTVVNCGDYELIIPAGSYACVDVYNLTFDKSNSFYEFAQQHSYCNFATTNLKIVGEPSELVKK